MHRTQMNGEKNQEVLRNVLENWKTKTIAQRGRAPPLSLDTPPASCSKRPQLRLMLRGETTAFRIRNGTAHQHPLKTAGLLGYPLSAGPHQSHIPLRCRGDHPILVVSITIRTRASRIRSACHISHRHKIKYRSTSEMRCGSHK